MSDVFISYSRPDYVHAQALANDLQKLKLSVWWDYNLQAGQSFRNEILDALNAARAAVVIWSNTAVISEWVLDEATRAHKAGKLVTTHLPGFDVSNLPLGFGQKHVVCVTDRDAVHKALQRVLSALQQPLAANERGYTFEEVLTQLCTQIATAFADARAQTPANLANVFALCQQIPYGDPDAIAKWKGKMFFQLMCCHADPAPPEAKQRIDFLNYIVHAYASGQDQQ